jgi:decaprenylphospho-beta-D-ribofuranose 2-oxidase
VHQGWGRRNKTKSKCFSVTEFGLDLKSNTSSGLAIGLGRSYGDSSIKSNGVYYTVSDNRKIEINSLDKTAKCGAGATIGDLERIAIKYGLFPPTVPGTEFVTIGGAIASNIHGKSHHIAGSFGNSVSELTLLTSAGKILNLKPAGASSKTFWATVGGMGLTGIIIEATIKLIEVQNAYIQVEEQRAYNLKELRGLIREFDKKYLYTVAWIDLSGSFSGRGKVLGGNHANNSQLPKKFKKKQVKIHKPYRLKIPDIFPSDFINSITVVIFNKIWFNKPLKNGIYKIRSFLHPLDSVKDWNRLYGKNGLIQYQFQISFENEFLLEEVLSEMKKYRLTSFLGVLKKLGNSDESFLGFAAPGWTLTIDIPAINKNNQDFLEKLTQRLCQLSGKVYLTKDSVLKEDDFNLMYLKKCEWKEIKKEMDPDNYWQSDQGRRLGLC